MADFGGMVLTDVGRNLQALVQTGEELNFVRIALGDGALDPGGDLEGYTELANERKSVSPTEATVVGDGTARIRGTLTNEGMETGFFIREIGLFAEDPDDEEAEILYAVAYASNPDYLPAGGGSTAVEQIIDLIVVVSNATNVVVTIDGDHYLTDVDLEAHNLDPESHEPIQINISAEIDDDIAAHNADGDAHPLIRQEIDDDITVHNNDETAHSPIRANISTEIDTDIETHNNDPDAHGGVGGDPPPWDDDIDEAIAAHNASEIAHTFIQNKIGTDIGTHNADEAAHTFIQNKIGTDIGAHNADPDSHDLATKIGNLQTEIDNDILAHNSNGTAHTDIRGEIDSDIAAHNVNEIAHQDIRAEIDSDISSHNALTDAHGIPESIAAHNVDVDAHSDLFGGVSDEIDADIAAHNASEIAHTFIQNKIGTDIAAHNSSANSHSEIRERGALKTIRQASSNLNIAVGDRILADTSGSAFTCTLPSSGESDVGDAVEIIDVGASFDTHYLTIGRNGMKIMGLSEDMICDLKYAAFRLVRDPAGWRIA